MMFHDSPAAVKHSGDCTYFGIVAWTLAWTIEKIESNFVEFA